MLPTRHIERSESSPNFVCLQIKVGLDSLRFASVEMTYKEKTSSNSITLKVNKLKTTDGPEVEVIDTGLHNHNAGPDFFNAKVKIGGTLWVVSV